jgi:hypothetical protein
MRHAAPGVLKILHFQFTEFLAAQRVVKQRRQDGAVALLLNGFIAGCSEKLAGLVIANGRRLAFAALSLRPLDAFDRIVADGIFLAEIFEQR